MVRQQLPFDAQRDIASAIALLDQLLWCWGQDIEHREGNLLIKAGLEKISPPQTYKDYASIYRCWLSNGDILILRGFGVMLLRGDKGLFLKRYGFQPLEFCATDPSNFLPWKLDLMPACQLIKRSCFRLFRQMCITLLDWILHYENWIIDQCGGTAHRREVLSKWDDEKRCTIPADQVAAAWRSLSFHIADHFDAFANQSGRPASAPSTVHNNSSPLNPDVEVVS